MAPPPKDDSMEILCFVHFLASLLMAIVLAWAMNQENHSPCGVSLNKTIS